jgi:hypothetical protein
MIPNMGMGMRDGVYRRASLALVWLEIVALLWLMVAVAVWRLVIIALSR